MQKNKKIAELPVIKLLVPEYSAWVVTARVASARVVTAPVASAQVTSARVAGARVASAGNAYALLCFYFLLQ